MVPHAALILVDVDGVLNPYQPEADGYRRHWVFPYGIPHRLSLHPVHGRMLGELAEATDAELVWASYWRNRANTWIAPRIGLASIRNVPIPSYRRLRAGSSLGGWKAAHVAAWIGQTPFVWFDDDPDVPALSCAAAWARATADHHGRSSGRFDAPSHRAGTDMA